MASHTRSWSNATPAESDDAGDGASEIRNHRVDNDERMTLDHWWDNAAATTNTTQDGYHKKVTLNNSTSVSAGVANTGILHVEDVSSKAELFYMDEDGNDVQVTSGGSINNQAFNAINLEDQDGTVYVLRKYSFTSVSSILKSALTNFVALIGWEVSTSGTPAVLLQREIDFQFAKSTDLGQANSSTGILYYLASS